MKSLPAFVLCMVSLGAWAQKPMDEPAEKNIRITQGPAIVNDTGTAATITWATSATAANHVKYRVGGGPWKTAYQPGGSTHHSLELTGLQPGQTVEWQILTRDGDLRTSGQFKAGARGAAAAAPPAPAAPAPGAAHVPLYRSDNPRTGQHFYTTNQGEISATVSQGWTPAVVVGYVATGQAGGTTALYRILIANGDHFYTTSADEKNAVLGQGAKDEGVVGYIATAQQPGTQPLHRMVGPQGMHLYTTSAAEVTSAAAQGYREEGVIGYVWTQ